MVGRHTRSVAESNTENKLQYAKRASQKQMEATYFQLCLTVAQRMISSGSSVKMTLH